MIIPTGLVMRMRMRMNDAWLCVLSEVAGYEEDYQTQAHDMRSVDRLHKYVFSFLEH